MKLFKSEYWRDFLIGVIFVTLIIVIGWLAIYYPIKPGFNFSNISGSGIALSIIWLCYFKLLIIIIRDNDATTRQVVRFAALSLSFMMSQIFTFAMLYKIGGLNTPLETTLDSADYIYFSIVTWTTVGYGDITPAKDSRLIASTEALSGFIYMGIFIGILGSFLLTSLNKSKETPK